MYGRHGRRDRGGRDDPRHCTNLERRIPSRWVWSDIDRDVIRKKLHVVKVLATILSSLAVPVVAFFEVYGSIVWLLGQDTIGLIAGLGVTWIVAIAGLMAAIARKLYVPSMVSVFVLFTANLDSRLNISICSSGRL